MPDLHHVLAGVALTLVAALATLQAELPPNLP